MWMHVDIYDMPIYMRYIGLTHTHTALGSNILPTSICASLVAQW